MATFRGNRQGATVRQQIRPTRLHPTGNPGTEPPAISAHRPRRGALATALVALVVVLAACGGGDDDGEAAAASSTTAAAVAITPSTVAPSTTTTTSTTTIPPLQLTDNAKLSTAGLGPVRIGMTLEEGERVSGVNLVPDDFGDDACRYHTPDRGPAGVSFMVSDGEIVRVDVFGEGAITTLSGYGIGTTAAELTEAFGERLETQPHPYDPDGQYIVFVPVDELDADKRVIWETDAEGTVTAMRAGRVPFVDFIEGCA